MATGSSSSCGQQSPVSTEDITAHEALPKRTPFSLRLGSFHFIQTWRRFDDHMLDKIIIACSIPYFQASLGPMSQIFTRSHISSGGSEPFSLHFACMSESTEAPPDCWHGKGLDFSSFILRQIDYIRMMTAFESYKHRNVYTARIDK